MPAWTQMRWETAWCCQGSREIYFQQTLQSLPKPCARAQDSLFWQAGWPPACQLAVILLCICSISKNNGPSLLLVYFKSSLTCLKFYGVSFSIVGYSPGGTHLMPKCSTSVSKEILLFLDHQPHLQLHWAEILSWVKKFCDSLHPHNLPQQVGGANVYLKAEVSISGLLPLLEKIINFSWQLHSFGYRENFLRAWYVGSSE